MTATECEFELGEMHFAGKRWGNPEGRRVLALHGWLDNSASFDFLAPLLPELDLVCADLAGHGKSDHRCHFGAYNIWQDVGEVFAMADALGWETFSLLGHSRGAAIAMLAAGTFPERVQNLALIEGIYPFTTDAQDAPKQLAESILSLKQQAAKHQTIYSMRERAIEARANGLYKVPLADARALAQRGLEHFEGGFTWAHDYKLMAASEVRFSRAQVEAFVNAIQAPIHLAAADAGLLATNAEVMAWLATEPKIQVEPLLGSHHLHMSGQCEAVAAWLRASWLL